MLECQFFIHASKSPVIIMNQLKSIYSSQCKDSHSHPIHTCFPIIASNTYVKVWQMHMQDFLLLNSNVYKVEITFFGSIGFWWL